MRIHALLFFLISSAAFGIDLYGGRPAKNAHLVKLSTNGRDFCQAVAITPTKFLTSGHCVQEMGLEIRETSDLLTYYPEMVGVHSNSDRAQAKVITLAPTYYESSSAIAEDLALIELPRALRGVEVLPVADQRDLVAGTKILLTANKEEADSKIIQRIRGLGGLILKSDGASSGICQGDSGGALILVKNGKKFLAGILSAQSEGCQRKHVLAYFPKFDFE